MWRDLGFAIGALMAGLIADRFGIIAAIWAVAVVTAVSGLVVLVRMYETHPGADAAEGQPSPFPRRGSRRRRRRLANPRVRRARNMGSGHSDFHG